MSIGFNYNKKDSREEIERKTQDFLAKGGAVQQIESGLRAVDPTKRINNKLPQGDAHDQMQPVRERD